MATAIPVRQRNARYVLEERLGAGGQGEVWRAHDTREGRDVALKILRPAPGRSEAAWEALLHEQANASRLDHPCILRVYEPERQNDGAFLLPMELATGGDLRQLRGATYLAVLPPLIEVAQALQHAHEQGVIHRDLKPGNVLFDARGHVKVADFGVSGCALDPGTDALIRGLSPFTASPEQLRGEPPSPADDIYGLGALAYELLSGHPPHYPNFDARRVQQEPAPPLEPKEPIPPELAALIMRMLAKDANGRPASMREVADEFDAALNATLTFDIEPPAEAPRGAQRMGPSADGGEARRASPALRAVQRTTPVQPMQAAAPVQSPAPMQAAAPVQPPAPTQATPTAGQPLAPMQAAAPMRATTPAHATTPVRASTPPVEPINPAGATTSVQATTARSFGLQDGAPIAPDGPGVVDGAALWEEVRDAAPPVGARLEPMRSGAPGIVLLLAGLAAAVLAAFLWLPNHLGTDAVGRFLQSVTAARLPTKSHEADTRSFDAAKPAEAPGPAEAADASEAAAPAEAAGASAAAGAADASSGDHSTPAHATADSSDALPQQFAEAQTAFNRHAASLESRGVSLWAGPDFAAATKRAAEAVGARDAGSPALAQERLAQAQQLLDAVEHAAPAALSAELAAGDRALKAGHLDRAQQAFELAVRIDPKSDAARAGLGRVKSALDDDRYTKAVAEGHAALGAGRPDDAHAAFERAVAVRPNGAEALEGLRRVDAEGHNIATLRARAAALETQERWDDALRAYESLLHQDRSLSFAQEGRERVADRLLLDESLQELIDRPDRLVVPQVRQQAATLLQQAEEQPDPGPVLRGQMARLSALLPGIDAPVHLSLVSDNVTQVAIPSIGSFGSFTRRDIELRPGHYTVVGTREGYREVRRDIVVSPGQEGVTINVSCDEPI